MRGRSSLTDPNWRERLVDAVGNNRNTRNSHGLTMATMSFRASTEFGRLISRAAKSRGVTRASYIRRVIGVALAADLQMPIVEVVGLGPRLTEPGKHSSMKVDLDTGEGVELWCPHPGCRGQHFELT